MKLSQIPCCEGACFFFDQLECLHTISIGPGGMVQPIAVAVLKAFPMMNKDGGIHPSTMLLQTLKEYEIITLTYKI